jgi:hypothetical protein
MGFFNEMDALKDHALEPFQNEPGKRRFVQIVFVLLCAAVGVGMAPGMAWLMRLRPSYRPLIHFRRQRPVRLCRHRLQNPLLNN